VVTIGMFDGIHRDDDSASNPARNARTTDVLPNPASPLTSATRP
jgi:FAD synthase